VNAYDPAVVVSVVANVAEVTSEEMLGKGRSERLLRTRRAAYWLLRHWCGLNDVQNGEALRRHNYAARCGCYSAEVRMRMGDCPLRQLITWSWLELEHIARESQAQGAA